MEISLEIGTKFGHIIAKGVTFFTEYSIAGRITIIKNHKMYPIFAFS